MSRNIRISPFVEQRKEKDLANTTIYINYEDYPKWASINNCLITGSRGTGKSSVLTSFDYRTRWFNSKSLVYSPDFSYLEAKEVCDTDIIGILFKADRVESELWNNCYTKSARNGALLFSTYINYFFAAKVLISVKDILDDFYHKNNCLLCRTSLIERLLVLCDPGWKRRYSFLYDFSVDGLITFFEEQRCQIRQVMYHAITEQLPSSLQMQSASSGFISDFCKVISEEIDVLSEKKFFLMIDDVDRFKDWQIRIINSFLKVTTFPCAWKISSSLPYQTLATEDDARISGTDLKISYLNDERVVGNEQQKDRIDELFNAIFHSRIKQHGSKDSVKTLFGKMNLESALRDVVEKSINPALKADYSKFLGSGKKYYTDYWLINKKIVQESEPSKKFDKYRVNATFAIVKANNLEDTFQYFSYDVIRSLCAGSPRHFLRICDSMWPAIYEKIYNDRSSEVEISRDEQNRAIRKASEELINIIDKDRFSRGIEVSCYEMYRRLGELFVLLTHNETSLRRSQECLSVKFDISDLTSEVNKDTLLKIIDKLTMLEVVKVRVDEATPSIYQLGLNPMLSPNFCLSFRSPFLSTFSVNANLFFKYLTSENKISPEALCRERIGDCGPRLFDEEQE
ncbi:MAG: hypothetical protein MJZ72_09310 [Bacteroidales bacterium]|nr:hypothetical protein [Bacteroidales bacterium]